MCDGDAIAGFDKLHEFEEIILKREFTEINYILPNSFNGVIELDWQGHPVAVDVKSNSEWRIIISD